MSTTKRTHNEQVSAAAAEKTAVVETIVTLYTNGIERLAEVQKKGIDVAVKQNTDLLDAWKNLAKVVPGAPGLFLLDLASNSFGQYAETQKNAIDLVLAQSHAIAGLVSEHTSSVAKATESAAAIVQQSVEHTVEAQKKALDQSAVQTKAAFKNARQQFGLAGTPAKEAADSFERGVDSLIESQKELLDIAAKPFSSIN